MNKIFQILQHQIVHGKIQALLSRFSSYLARRYGRWQVAALSATLRPLKMEAKWDGTRDRKKAPILEEAGAHRALACLYIHDTHNMSNLSTLLAFPLSFTSMKAQILVDGSLWAPSLLFLPTNQPTFPSGYFNTDSESLLIRESWVRSSWQEPSAF